MARFNWFRRQSPLEKAIRRGIAPGGDLEKELEAFSDVGVRTRAEAEVLCDALEQARSSGGLRSLIGLIERLEEPEDDAIDLLRDEAIPALIRLVDDAADRFDERAVFAALGVLAECQMTEATDAVLRALRRPIRSKEGRWHSVLKAFNDEHDDFERFYREMTRELPADPIAATLLSLANDLALTDKLRLHPFDTIKGLALLERWLRADEDDDSDAATAAVALAFLKQPGVAKLRALSVLHTSPVVRVEACWAWAKTGAREGIDALAAACLEVNQCGRGVRYMKELGLDDDIPAAALDPEFAARAAFAEWLSHPSELGRFPDEVEVIDHRILPWPPRFEPTPLFLIRFRVKGETELDDDDVGVGLVGGATWCFFSPALNVLPAQDLYATHYVWELEEEMLTRQSVGDGSTEYDGLLSQWSGPALESPQIKQVMEIDPRLGYPRRLIAYADAKTNGEEGWAVLDGPDSAWYAAKSFPEGMYGGSVRDIHLGRKLLGLEWRNVYRPPAPTKAAKAPQFIVSAYERLLEQARSADPDSAHKLLTDWRSPLKRHFERYVDALQVLRGGQRETHVIAAFEGILQISRTLGSIPHAELFSTVRAIKDSVSEYLGALITVGRCDDALSIIRLILPHWQHNLGYSILGSAAYRCGDLALAKELLTKLREGMPDDPREEMALLADLLHREGRASEARALLIDSMRKIAGKVGEPGGHTRAELQDAYGPLRGMFVQLFPGEATPRDLPESLIDWKRPADPHI